MTLIRRLWQAVKVMSALVFLLFSAFVFIAAALDGSFLVMVFFDVSFEIGMMISSFVIIILIVGAGIVVVKLQCRHYAH